MAEPVEDVTKAVTEEIDRVGMLVEKGTELLIEKSPQIIAAFLVLIVGAIFAKIVANVILKLCGKKEIDITLARFFASFTKLIIIVLFVIVAVSKLGIELTPFVALLGAGALGLSLAVQGPVSNFGSGIVLIITRPFKVDDTLTVLGLTGIVDEVNLGSTRLKTEDGQEITIPNRKILGEVLTNSFELMVVEGVVGIEYGADPERAIEAVSSAIVDSHGVADEKAPQVGIQGFGDSSIDIGYRYWVKTADYYTIQYEVNLSIFKELKRSEIGIPFPQREVRMLTDEA